MSLRTQPRPTHAPAPSDSAFSGISAYQGVKTPAGSSDGHFSRQQQSSGQGAYASSPNGSNNITSPVQSYNSGTNNPSSRDRDRDNNQPSGTTATGNSTTSSSSSKPQISPEQSRAIARTHFDALRSWLARENALGPANSPRNNARDKLTRLTRQQFQELSTDVYDELVRRMEEAAGRPGDQPFLSVRSEFHPKRNQARQKLATLPLGRFRDLASDVYFELERRYPDFIEEEVPEIDPSANNSNNNRPVYSPPVPLPSSTSANSLSRVASPPTTGSSATRDKPPMLNTNISRGGGRVPTPTTTTNDVVVPNKSTMVVEEATGGGGNGGPSPSSGGRGGQAGGYGMSSPTEYGRPGTGGSERDRDMGGGMMGGMGYGDHQQETLNSGPGQGGGSGLGGARNGPNRISETSSIGTRFIGNYAGSTANSEVGRKSWDQEELEKVKSEYEYKITMLQNRMSEIQRENDDMREALKRYEDQSTSLSNLQSDYETLQATRSASSRHDDTHRERLTQADEVADELRSEVASLLAELRDEHAKIEELVEARQKDLKDRADIEEEVKSWRRKYEQAKTELRNVKATSMFVANIKMENDHMPASPDGLIADVNVTAFQASIDDLLQAARSKEPSSILLSMRTVVGAVEKIDSDVQSVDPSRLQSLPLAEQDRLQSLKAKTNATLSNLTTACKNHATSFGLSPVSLVDAAASHLSATLVDLIRILKIRRTTGPTPSSSASSRPRPEEDQRPSPPPLPPSKANGYGQPSGVLPSGQTREAPASETSSIRSPPLRSPTEYLNNNVGLNNNGPNSNVSSRGLNNNMGGGGMGMGGGPGGMYPGSLQQDDDDRYRRAPSPGYSQASSYGAYANHESPRVQPNGMDNAGAGGRQRMSSYENDTGYGGGAGTGEQYRGSVLTYGSPNPGQEEQREDNLEQLKIYLENQTEAIVHSIQSLLSAIRSGAQGEQLNENLTQIITIVSSIVAISKDALPDHSRVEGDEILRDLADNCDKLSGMSQSSNSAVFDKATKQAMASASFGVAKSLKALNALLDTQPDSLT
ncbi:hypothetical protein T439DRAFT_330639 [Meredithblackwellia eburnea MCA 4105]